MKHVNQQQPAFAPFADFANRQTPGDIVIVGAGLAGLFAALKLSPLPVTIVSAAPLGEGASSAWAQGGIAASVGIGDTSASHAADTIAAGAGLVDQDVAHTIAAEAPDRIADLLQYGVPFDRDLTGHFVLSREAAHSEKRVVRVAGDRAGHAIMQSLISAVRKTPSIRVLEGFAAEDLIVEEGAIAGVRLMRTRLDGNTAFELVPARAVVLATGGISGLFAATTNPEYARGEGIGMAARAGATISDAEFVQFHPTALDVQARPTPLATEALRGEGATLVNADGHRFMAALHDEAELAPRDIVARAVFEERATGRGAFLDCRSSIGAHFKKRFPTVYAHCQHHDLDPETDLIPVTPAAHYHMGGIATDLNARTDVVGLWAMGEVAATGLHGANRLASNSLLEATVMAARVAADITANTRADDLVQAELRACPPGGRVCEPERSMMLERLGQTLSSNVGVVRSQSGLNQALHTITKIHIAAKNSQDLALLNASLAAAFVVTSALARPESRGAHFRSDTPNAKPSLAHRSFVTLQDVTSAMTDVLSDPHQRAIHVSRSNKKPSTDPIAALHGVSA